MCPILLNATYHLNAMRNAVQHSEAWYHHMQLAAVATRAWRTQNTLTSV